MEKSIPFYQAQLLNLLYAEPSRLPEVDAALNILASMTVNKVPLPEMDKTDFKIVFTWALENELTTLTIKDRKCFLSVIDLTGTFKEAGLQNLYLEYLETSLVCKYIEKFLSN